MRKKHTHRHKDTGTHMDRQGICVCAWGVTMCKIQRAKSRTQTISQRSQSAPATPLPLSSALPLSLLLHSLTHSVSQWGMEASTRLVTEFEWRFRRKQYQS